MKSDLRGMHWISGANDLSRGREAAARKTPSFKNDEDYAAYLAGRAAFKAFAMASGLTKCPVCHNIGNANPKRSKPCEGCE